MKKLLYQCANLQCLKHCYNTYHLGRAPRWLVYAFTVAFGFVINLALGTVMLFNLRKKNSKVIIAENPEGLVLNQDNKVSGRLYGKDKQTSA